jgi:nucleoside-diphosphate-sugar epimerase
MDRFAAEGHETMSISRSSGCDVLVHCAALISKSLTDRAVSLVNAAGTQQVIEAAGLLGARTLIYISSVPIIGKPTHLPVDEDHPVNPPTAYHAAKLYGEHLMGLARTTSLRTVSLRITSPVGRGTPRGRIFSEFVHRASLGEPLMLAGRGERRQNYVDVRDVAAAVFQSANSEADGMFLVAGESSVSNLELAQSCISTLRSTSQIVFSDTPDEEEDVRWDISTRRAHEAFGYTASHGIEDSIAAAASS